MQNGERLTTYEGLSIIAVSFLFTAFGGGLSQLTKACGNAGWIAVLFGGLLSVGYFFLYWLLAKRFDNKNIVDISKEVFGTVVSKLVACLLLVYFWIFTIENVAEATHMLVNNTYARFRPIVVSIAILAVAGIVCRYPLKGLARTVSIALPVFFVGQMLILILNINQYDTTYLYPILGHGWQPIATNGISHLVHFDGLLLAMVFLDGYGSGKSFRKAGWWALLLGNLSFILSALCYNMAAPFQANQRSQDGLLDLARAIYINRFFQRFESLFILIVSLGKILVVCLGVAASLKLFNSLFDIPEGQGRGAILPTLMIILGGGQFLYNQQAFWSVFAELTYKVDLIFVLALLLALLLVGLFRRGKRPTLRTASLLLVGLLSVSLLGGCSQIMSEEADDEIFAIVMGYDRSDSETLRITVKILPEDKNSSGGSGGGAFADQEGGSGGNVFSVDAPCNIPAADLINSVIPKHLSLLHVKMLVVSEELVREDVDMLLSSITRYNEIKPVAAVVVCDGSAEEYITARASELIPFISLETEMILKKEKESANYLVRSLGDIYHSFSSTTGDALAMYGGLTMDARAARAKGGSTAPQEEEDASDTEDDAKQEDDSKKSEKQDKPPSQQGQGDPEAYAGGNVPAVFYDDPDVGYINGYLPGEVPITTAAETQIIGMAVFREMKMVGTLNSHETQMFMIAEGSFSGSVIPVRDPYKPDYYIMYYANNRKATKIDTSIDEDGKAHINVRTFMHAKPVVVHNSDPDYRDPEEHEKLRQYTTEYLEGELRALIDKIQGEYDADSLRLGRYMASHFLTNQEWEEYNWREKYKDAEITISVDLKM